MSGEEFSRMLSNVRDPNTNAKVAFEIIPTYSDSREFMVAARIKPPRSIASIFIQENVDRTAENLERNGMLIRQTMENQFTKECVISLEEYLLGRHDHHYANGEENTSTSRISNLVSGVFGALGFTRWYNNYESTTIYDSSGRNSNGEDQTVRRSNKRRRTS